MATSVIWATMVVVVGWLNVERLKADAFKGPGRHKGRCCDDRLLLFVDRVCMRVRMRRQLRIVSGSAHSLSDGRFHVDHGT